MQKRMRREKDSLGNSVPGRGLVFFISVFMNAPSRAACERVKVYSFFLTYVPSIYHVRGDFHVHGSSTQGLIDLDLRKKKKKKKEEENNVITSTIVHVPPRFPCFHLTCKRSLP